MSIEVRLTGAAAEQAQHLVADLASRGIPVEALNNADTNRDARDLLNDFGVQLAVEATYVLVRDLVRAWADRSDLPEVDTEVLEPTDEDEED